MKFHATRHYCMTIVYNKFKIMQTPRIFSIQLIKFAIITDIKVGGTEFNDESRMEVIGLHGV